MFVKSSLFFSRIDFSIQNLNYQESKFLLSCMVLLVGFTMFSTVFQSCLCSQSTYPCVPGYFFTITIQNFPSKSLTAFSSLTKFTQVLNCKLRVIIPSQHLSYLRNGQLPSRTIALPDDCPLDDCPPDNIPPHKVATRTIALPIFFFHSSLLFGIFLFFI